jgi:hypothetical protein
MVSVAGSCAKGTKTVSAPEQDLEFGRRFERQGDPFGVPNGRGVRHGGVVPLRQQPRPAPPTTPDQHPNSQYRN